MKLNLLDLQSLERVSIQNAMRGRSGIDGSVIFDNLPELKSVLFTGESFYYAFDFVLCGRE